MSDQANPTAPHSREQLAQLERRARRFWVSLIVGLLGIQVLIGVGSIYLSIGDPTVAIIPNYHQAALDWDVKQRAQATLHQLGWQLHAAVGPLETESLKRMVAVNITDRQGQPIPNLNVDAVCFHHARGGELYSLQFTELTPGQYRSATTLTRPGLWQIEFRLEGQQGIAGQSLELEVD